MKSKKIISAVLAAALALGAVTVAPAASQSTAGIAITAEAAKTTSAKLAAPKGIKTKKTSTSVTITWNAVDGADAYRVTAVSPTASKKTVKGTKCTFSKLESNTAYTFKITSLKKTDGKYKAGKSTKEFTVTTSKAKTTTAKDTSTKTSSSGMTEISTTAEDLLGVWSYYDFSEKVKYDQGTNYNPKKIETSYAGWYEQIQITSKDTMVVSYSDNSSELAKITDTKMLSFCAGLYKVYTYGEDKYLFMQFGDGEYTYIFKYTAGAPEAERINVTDVSELNGTWTTVDRCEFDLTQSQGYNPLYPVGNDSLPYTSIVINGDKVFLTGFGDEGKDWWLSRSDIGKMQYYVYKIGSDLYLYLDWGKGLGSFYVFKKTA